MGVKVGNWRGALVALLVVALTGCTGAQTAASTTASPSKDWSSSTTNTETAPPKTPIQQALGTCKLSMGTESISDSGHTVTLRWGKDTVPGYPRELPDSDVKCVLDATGMPSAYWQQILQTRAIDGMQHAAWGTFKATWTYHPDDGANLILTDNL